MFNVTPEGPIRGLEFNQYVCFSFHGDQANFDWGITNAIWCLTLKTEGQGHDENQPKLVR